MICVISNMDKQKNVAIMSFNDKQICYITNDEELKIYLNLIFDFDDLNIEIDETVNGNLITLNKIVNTNNDMYLYAMLESLPYPYTILKYSKKEEDIKDWYIKEVTNQ